MAKKVPVFNSDILANDGDYETFAPQFPDIADFIYWPKLVEAFKAREDEAVLQKGKAKERGMRALYWALASIIIITFARVLSLLIAYCIESIAAVPAASAVSMSDLVVNIGWLLTLIVGLWYANRSLFGRRRTRWLTARACSERLRQTYFQHLTMYFGHLCSSDLLERSSALKARDAILIRVISELAPERKPVLSKVINDVSNEECLLVPAPAPAQGALDPKRAKALYEYLMVQRIDHQGDHAMRMLEPHPKEHGTSIELQFQRHRDRFTLFSIGFIIFQVLAGIFFVASYFTAEMKLGSTNISFAAILQMIAFGFAAFGAAERVFEDGMHLRGDLLRYRTYYGITERIRREFNPVMLQTSEGRDKLCQLWCFFEELSYWEMHEFLQLHKESSFSL